MTRPARIVPPSGAGEWAFEDNEARARRRRNSILFEEEIESIDDTVVGAAEERLAGLEDLRQGGLTRQEALWVKQATYRKQSDMTGAEISMTGRSRGEADRTERDEGAVPVPIVFKDHEIDRRDLEASRNTGADLDTMDQQAAGRQVIETLEDLLFNGGGPEINGNVIEGYTNFADRNTVSKGASSSWDDLTDLTKILVHVLDMVQAAEDADMGGGPWWLYVPVEFFSVLADDFKAESDISVIERLRSVPGMQAIRFVDHLAVNNVVLVRATSDVVELVVGNDVDNVEVSSDIDFLVEMKAWAAMAPQLKSTFSNQSGIVHLTLQD